MTKASVHNLDEFSKIAILEEGRIKPLDSFARNFLLKIYGKDHYKKQSAIGFFAELIFEPSKSINKKIFLINNPELIESLGLKVNNSRYYSFGELNTASIRLFEFAQIAETKEKKDKIDLEYIRIFDNFKNFNYLTESLSFSRENPEIQEEVYKIGLRSSSLHQLILQGQYIANLLEKYKEPSLIKISTFIYESIEAYKNSKEYFKNTSLLILPPSERSKSWTSPWDALLDGDTRFEILLKLQKAYNNQDQKNFDKICKILLEQNFYPQSKINLEIFYNKSRLLKLALGFYLLALLLMVFNSPFVNYSIYLGACLHFLALICRIIILERPPVTNLYETFIFVSFISVLTGLIIRNNTGSYLSSLAGFLLLLISGKFASEGDSMRVLVAVLDSNFWLSTHVICISLGYAIVFSAAIISHLSIINLLQKKDFKQSNLIMKLISIGLCFSFIGTMLGGIWADQSWGRFWGWDPKENGALLIVLYTAAMLHARIAGLIKDKGIAISGIFAGIVVIFSWFGINLLGIGLHSYGFNQNIATIFWSFLAFEFFFLSLSCILIAKNK